MLPKEISNLLVFEMKVKTGNISLKFNKGADTFSNKSGVTL